MKKTLERDLDNGYIGGVCSGLADYTNMYRIEWRLLFLLGFGPVLYIFLWLILKDKK